MNILIIMILSSLLLGIIFLLCFIYTIYSGQFDDYESHKIRILINDNNEKEKNTKKQ